MVRRKVMGLLACALVVSAASMAWAGVPDLSLSSASTVATAKVSVFSLPNGGGDGVDNSFLYGGTKTDATITVTLLDSNSAPIFAYPFEDLWLENATGGMALCAGGSVADANTDAAGQTTFSGTLFAGGQSDPLDAGEGCDVMVNGSPLNQPVIDMLFNSPDISGDLVVNLTDVIQYTQDFYSGNSGDLIYRSDFYWDGNLNLSDTVLLSQGSGAQCP